MTQSVAIKTSDEAPATPEAAAAADAAGAADVGARVARLQGRFPAAPAGVAGDETLDQKIAESMAILRAAIAEEFPARIALVSSFGAEAGILLHLVSRVAPDTPVIFLETGKHFAQTLSYRRAVEKQFGLTDVRDVPPPQRDLAAEDPAGDLWRSDPDRCCEIRKVRPLKDALAGFDAWITGRKQFHGGARMALPTFEASNGQIKVNPLIRWTPEDIDAYAARFELPRHPLVAQGFPSIGCWPCTKPASAEEGVRAGRWRGADKTECGIHSI